MTEGTNGGRRAGPVERVAGIADGARGVAILLSPNPMHDTGGGQRSAQIALELLARDFAVVFVAHDRVTETVDLRLRFDHPRLLEVQLEEWARAVGWRFGRGRRRLRGILAGCPTIAIAQVPVKEWLGTLDAVRRSGGVAVFDLIDNWASELGGGWYRPAVERRIARRSDLLVASAPVLAAHLEAIGGRPVHPLPNAFNDRVFRPDPAPARPADLREGRPTVLYVGSLWGGWMDWSLVRRLATELPEVDLVFVGDHRGEGRDLPENCRLLGLRPQTALPGYLAHATLGFLPWKVDPITRATSPLKVYEYVAMGLRVVAPPIEPLAGVPGVAFADTPDAFAAAIRERLARAPSPEETAAMRAFAAKNSWRVRVDALLDLAAGSGAQAVPGTTAAPGSA